MPVSTIDPPIREAVLRLMRGGYTAKRPNLAGCDQRRNEVTRAGARPQSTDV